MPRSGFRRRAITCNAQEPVAWSSDLPGRGEAQNSLPSGSILKKANRLREYGRGTGKVAARVMVKITPHKMLNFRGRGAGLQVVGERDDREEDQNQYREGRDLHARAVARRVVSPSAAAAKPESKECGGNTHPEQIKEQLHNE